MTERETANPTEWLVICSVLLLIAVLLYGSALVAVLMKRFRKPETTPNHARLVAKPGATLDLVSGDGTAVAKVVLLDITHDYREGTSARFVDYFVYLERNRIRR